MKSINELKIGDFVSINDTDRMVLSFLTDKMFKSLDVEHLRVMCKIKNEKFYEVVDVCKSCQSVKIKVGDKYPNIKFHNLFQKK